MKKYSEVAIECVKERLTALITAKGTPSKHAGILYEAYRVIQQLQDDLAAAREDKKIEP